MELWWRPSAADLYSRSRVEGINSRARRSTLRCARVTGRRMLRLRSMPNRRPTDLDFEALAAAHLDSAYSLAGGLVRDRELADDVVQDAMLRALKYFPGYRGENARAWLLQIVRNVAFTRLQDGARTAGAGMEASRVEFESATLAVP